MERYERWADATFRAKLNSLRSSRGAPALALNWRLSDQADSWSTTMKNQNWLRHAGNYGQLSAQVVPNYQGAAENVGRISMSWCSEAQLKSVSERAVSVLHSSFVNSSAHYRNMVGGYNQVGIGVEIARDRLWVTYRFVKGSVPTYSGTALSTHDSYVSSVHQLFVERAATSAERVYWSRKVIDTSRSPLTNTLAVSEEWAGERIDDLYRKVLGREPDPGGRASWLRALVNGTRLESIATGFYGSTEYYNQNGRTRRGFVTALYEDILGRTPRSSEVDGWVNKIRNGMSRRGVAKGFYGSYESRVQRVRSLYQLILGRNVDPTGLRTWTRNLTTMGDIRLAAVLATSKEYFNRAT